MGETIIKAKVSNLTNEKSVEIEMLVDTGATYTSISGKILEELKVPKVRKVNIEFANGKVEPRFMGDVYIEVEGIKVPNQVIFADETDAIVLGLVTLESCGLTVDPVNRKLVPLPRIHHYRLLFKGLTGHSPISL